MAQSGTSWSDITSPLLANDQNINQTFTTSQAAVPAYLVIHDRNAVGIGGPKLSEILSLYYRAGVRYIEVTMVVAGQALLADCKINVRYNRQRNKMYIWAYPLQPAQALLRDFYYRYRGEARRRARKPMPVLIFAIRPK